MLLEDSSLAQMFEAWVREQDLAVPSLLLSVPLGHGPLNTAEGMRATRKALCQPTGL